MVVVRPRSPDAVAPCLTQKRGGEAEGGRVTVGATQTSWAAAVLRSSVEETIDAKTACDPGPRATGDDERETAVAGRVAAGDVETSSTASGPVFATVAQVRGALLAAAKKGHDNVVVWGRCARCGRVGQVVHFDGALRARAREPG